MFDILDHLDSLDNVEEHSTWYQALCPVCEGKLKINKSNSSYACYTEMCHEEKDSYGYNAIRRNLQPYQQRKTKLKRYTRIQIVDPCLFTPASLDLDELASNTTLPFSYLDRGNTVYPYKEFEVVRTPAKDIFLRHHEGELGIPAKLKHPYVYPAIDYLSSSIVAIVEGEKCADVCVEAGLWAYTIPCFAFNGAGTNVLARSLVEHDVDRVVIFADNDKPGKKKAEKVELALWAKRIKTHTVVFDTFRSGYDVADYLQENSWNELRNILLGKHRS